MQIIDTRLGYLVDPFILMTVVINGGIIQLRQLDPLHWGQSTIGYQCAESWHHDLRSTHVSSAKVRRLVVKPPAQSLFNWPQPRARL